MKKLTISFVAFLIVPHVGVSQELKNVQVLPFETKKEITSYMKNSVAKSLGVKCKFCHNLKDYSSDENPHKRVAREMMRMLAKINDQMPSIQKVAKESGMKHWDEVPVVECWVCHRGNTDAEYVRPK